jgi:hypothetical protein
MDGEIQNISDVFFQEFEFGGIRAPAAVWGTALLFGLVFLGTTIWIYQFNKSE